ncbi:TetR/AcrR family transcriptional regulator [Acidocella sp.]|uniref:TetR/AcrR family transcriptional regulator n=1 Tax=Acidocella sp. TaxID=50710 RepID=UPI00261880DF|nr:TetR/AcrR family transcriptional regulator [Acidocella sp.]
MRFEKGHKEQTRQRIVETASRKFREDGVAATGIAGLMAEAGLTHGGFYAHFASKEALVRAALDDALAQGEARRAKLIERAGAEMAPIEALIRAYLRPAHRDAPAQGCAVAGLAAEIARHDLKTRAVFTVRLARLLAQMQANLPPGMDEAARERLAIGLFGTLLGCLQMARAVADPARSDLILQSGIEAGLALVTRLPRA